MAKIRLYIAATLDGYIARENGSLDWLFEIPNPGNIDHGYKSLMENTDVVVMGRKTYEEVLGFGIEWPYSEQKTFVFTTRKDFSPKTAGTFLMDEVSESSVKMLRAESMKGIWLVGGGELVSHFLRCKAVDELIISVIPVILGKGIRLFIEGVPETRLRFIHSESFETGIVNLSYRITDE